MEDRDLAFLNTYPWENGSATWTDGQENYGGKFPNIVLEAVSTADRPDYPLRFHDQEPLRGPDGGSAL